MSGAATAWISGRMASVGGALGAGTASSVGWVVVIFISLRGNNKFVTGKTWRAEPIILVLENSNGIHVLILGREMA